MKIKHIIVILASVSLLAIAGLYLTPESLSEPELEKAMKNRKEIIRSSEGDESAEVEIISNSKVDSIKQKEENIQPAPVEVVSSGDEESGFQSYIDYMHKAAPGVDYRYVNNHEREKRYIERSGQNLRAEPTQKFASGRLTGWWEERGSKNLAGSIAFCEWDKDSDIIYAASAGGNIWRGKPDGTGWKVLNDLYQFDNLSMLRIIPIKNGKRLIASMRKQVMYSDNDGMVWKKSSGLDNIEKWGGIQYGVTCDDSLKTIYILALDWDYSAWKARTSLYKSKNKGVSFTLDTFFYETPWGDYRKFSLFTPGNHIPYVYLLAANSLYRIHTDSGIYVPLYEFQGLSGSRYLTGSIHATRSVLYAIHDKQVYYSSDTGKTFQYKGDLPVNPFTRYSVMTGFSNTDEFYLGGVDCYKSTNQGIGFTKIYAWADYYGDIEFKLHADIMGIQEFLTQNGDRKFIVSCHGGIYISDDGLTNVKNISLQDLNVSQYYDVYTDREYPENIHTGSQDQGYQATHTDNGGPLNFVQEISGDYGHLVSGNQGKSIFMNYPGFTQFYPNARQNATGRASLGFTSKGQVWIPPLCADPTNPNRCFLGGGSDDDNTSHIYTLIYDPGTKKLTSSEGSFDFGVNSSDRITAIHISPADPNFRYVMTDKGNFWYSSDAGNNWNLSSGIVSPGGNYLYGATVITHPQNPAIVWVGGSGYSNSPFYMSMDTGITFKPFSSGIPSTMIFEMTPDDSGNFIFAATDAGPYVFDMKDTVWINISGLKAPDQTYWSVEYIPGIQTVRFATYGRGVFDFHLGTAPNTGNILYSKEINSISIYPNPQLSGQTSHIPVNEAGEYRITISSMDGKTWMEKNISVSGGNIETPVLTKGIYIISIYKNNILYHREKYIIQ